MGLLQCDTLASRPSSEGSVHALSYEDRSSGEKHSETAVPSRTACVGLQPHELGRGEAGLQACRLPSVSPSFDLPRVSLAEGEAVGNARRSPRKKGSDAGSLR